MNETMWQNIVEQDRPQMTIWLMRISWVPEATNTHSRNMRECVCL